MTYVTPFFPLLLHGELILVTAALYWENLELGACTFRGMILDAKLVPFNGQTNSHNEKVYLN